MTSISTISIVNAITAVKHVSISIKGMPKVTEPTIYTAGISPRWV